MKTTPLPSIEYLHERLMYDEKSGKLLWKPRYQMLCAESRRKSWNTRYSGKEAGCLSFDKFGKPRAVVVQLLFPDGKKRLVYAHRLILHMLSKLPEKGFEVDHIDGDPFNNRISNLRVCLHIENSQNLSESHRRKKSPTNVGLPMGVRLKRDKYIAEISHTTGGVSKKFFLGSFTTAEKAHRAYLRASYKLRGRFARVHPETAPLQN